VFTVLETGSSARDGPSPHWSDLAGQGTSPACQRAGDAGGPLLVIPITVDLSLLAFFKYAKLRDATATQGPGPVLVLKWLAAARDTWSCP